MHSYIFKNYVYADFIHVVNSTKKRRCETPVGLKNVFPELKKTNKIQYDEKYFVQKFEKNRSVETIFDIV